MLKDPVDKREAINSSRNETYGCRMIRVEMEMGHDVVVVADVFRNVCIAVVSFSVIVCCEGSDSSEEVASTVVRV